ncbi:MAG: UDP-N-acetylmuramoyl-L-alanyl-D-glutamate--2,6-diaminopimelate ligase, partial [Clostridia bacterium]|nr:UDP-N-acetylmuramoyl-L-alanyl-D-glutamate--2,6-diaminopimelate ligase [Clostridia bacterium]
ITVPQIIVKNTRIAMALAAAEFYDHPADSMRIIGITGTNGKTSTTYMLKSIFECDGKKVGIIGTICVMIGDRKIHSERTTPDSIHLQETLALMRDEGVEVVLMEVSSHALDQNRVYGIVFDVAEFTNITVDHLDYHGTFEKYLEAKKKLFSTCVNAVINLDDAHAMHMLSDIKCPVTTFGLDSRADMFASEIEYDTEHTAFTVCRGKDKYSVQVPIPGKFTVYNALGAACVAYNSGVSTENIAKGLSSMKGVAGRIEPLPTYGRGFSVYLDYAHTPDALENVIRTVREIAKGRIVTLFGCGGDRDSSKRADMGEIAGKLSDFLVVTSDNPRTENPMSIIDMVLSGVKRTDCEHVVIENRRDAIAYALTNAKENDIIILAGKGHEDYQEINGEKLPFDEKIIVDEMLRR